MKKPAWLHFILISAGIFFLLADGLAQVITPQQKDSLSTSYIDISKIGLKKPINYFCSGIYINKNQDLQKVFAALHFASGIITNRTVLNKFVTKKALLKFNIFNSADTTVAVYFFPGFYYKKIQLYEIKASGLEKLSSILPGNQDSIGFRLLSLPAHDSATIIAELSFVKTYVNAIRPRFVNPQYVDSFVSELHSTHRANDLVTYLFCGLLLMMVLYSMANFFQGANPEFLYYSGYAFFLGLLLFTKAALTYHSTRLSFFVEGYFDFIMQGLGIMFYMIFMQRFLNTRTNYRFLYHLYNVGIVLLLTSLFSYSYFHYFSDNFVVENMVENITKFLLLVLVIVFLISSARHRKDKLFRYLFWGNFWLFIFSLVSQATVMVKPHFKNLPAIFDSALFYYEIGLLLELVFFLAALNHKSRRQIIEQTKEREQLKAENQMKEYEKELAVYKAQQQERERISADMHDELGSGLTAIRLMSEIARNKMKENTPVEIERISQSANDVLNNMNAIIWSMNIGNDSLDNLISYIRSYSLEYFENTQIECKVNTPGQIVEKELTGDKRLNVFLCVKETLNNALKHSRASLITINISTDNSLKIKITDNGIGIDMEKLRRFGNGLTNIARRMESIDGTYRIENNGGTQTTLELPL